MKINFVTINGFLFDERVGGDREYITKLLTKTKSLRAKLIKSNEYDMIAITENEAFIIRKTDFPNTLEYEIRDGPCDKVSFLFHESCLYEGVMFINKKIALKV